MNGTARAKMDGMEAGLDNEVKIDHVVRAVLAEHGVRFDSAPGPRLAVPYGSAEVRIEFDDLGHGVPLVRVSAVVLSSVEAGEREEELSLLRALNDRNRALRFGSLSWSPETKEVVLAYTILGSHLQPQELLNAVMSVARTADEHDDMLAEGIGGLRASDRR